MSTAQNCSLIDTRTTQLTVSFGAALRKARNLHALRRAEYGQRRGQDSFDPFSPNFLAEHGLCRISRYEAMIQQSDHYRLRPVIAGLGVHEPGQNRDKFPGRCSLTKSPPPFIGRRGSGWCQLLLWAAALACQWQPTPRGRPSRMLVIYCRYSSEMQSPKSCVDQEREVRQALDRLGIVHKQAVVIYDEAESGTKSDRGGFERILEMIRYRQLAILAVDDQARLSRAGNAASFVQDLVFAEGRFLSTGEGIDTTQAGWELRVKALEMHNSVTVTELGRRVRRGQAGRVERKLTAGDYPYGYESFLVNPQAVLQSSRGPKPEKNVRVVEEQAVWIRQMFAWFLAGESIAKIAAKLTAAKAPRGSRARKSNWTATNVRKILDNPKYIGHWLWGATTTLRNSQGKTKKVNTPEKDHVLVERPDLRIITQEIWEKAQARLAELHDIYGQKEGQASRGPVVHHTAAYPGSLLGGLLYCGRCGARMWSRRSGPRTYLRCPNAGEADGMCTMLTTVPINRAETALLDFVSQLLAEYPDWMQQAIATMRMTIAEAATRIPPELAAAEKRLAELAKTIDNLVDSIASGNDSDAVQSRLARDERERDDWRKRVVEMKHLLAAPIQMPDEEWIAQQFRGLPALLREDGPGTAMLLRKLLNKVEVHPVIPPGKVRGWPQLRFTVCASAACDIILPRQLSKSALPLLSNSTIPATTEHAFQLDLGEPSRMDNWGPQIVKMRADGKTWEEVVEATGLGLGPAYIAWKRCVDNASPEAAADGHANADEA